MLRTMDPGTMGGDEGAFFRAASLLVTIGGVLVVSSLIGLLANGIADKLAELRKGRSPVMESGHTLILGWSPKAARSRGEVALGYQVTNGAGVEVVINPRKDRAVTLGEADCVIVLGEEFA